MREQPARGSRPSRATVDPCAVGERARCPFQNSHRRGGDRAGASYDSLKLSRSPSVLYPGRVSGPRASCASPAPRPAHPASMDVHTRWKAARPGALLLSSPLLLFLLLLWAPPSSRAGKSALGTGPPGL